MLPVCGLETGYGVTPARFQLSICQPLLSHLNFWAGALFTVEFTTELRRQYRDFPHTLPHSYSASHPINIIHQNGAFGTQDEPALTPYNHPKPIAYISLHAWWLHSIGTSKSTTTYYSPYSHTESGLRTKRPRGSVYSSPLPWHLVTTSLVCAILPSPDIIQAGNIPYGAFSLGFRTTGFIH